MELSIVIVTYNAAEFLPACLRSIAQHLDAIDPEVCIVDNASTDGSADVVARDFPWVRLSREPRNLGFAAGVNRGLGLTSGRYVLWLNPDAMLLDNGLAELMAYMDRNPTVGILGPQIVDPDGGLQLSRRAFPSYDWALGHRYSVLTRWFPGNRFTRRYLLPDLSPDTIQDVDWVSGACLLHSRALVAAIGGLDERFFMYCEDVDFCLRAKQGGWAVQYHPGARVLHHIGGSTRKVSRAMLVARHRSLWRYYEKHFARNPLTDPVAWAAIWGRCGVVVAMETLRGLGRRA